MKRENRSPHKLNLFLSIQGKQAKLSETRKKVKLSNAKNESGRRANSKKEKPKANRGFQPKKAIYKRVEARRLFASVCLRVRMAEAKAILQIAFK